MFARGLVSGFMSMMKVLGFPANSVLMLQPRTDSRRGMAAPPIPAVRSPPAASEPLQTPIREGNTSSRDKRRASGGGGGIGDGVNSSRGGGSANKTLGRRTNSWRGGSGRGKGSKKKDKKEARTGQRRRPLLPILPLSTI